MHVASVVQMIHMIMHHGGLLRKKVVDDLMMLAGYIAAAIHDFEHGGVNNDFLIQTRDKLAVTYNDISPLENHHLAAAARLMSETRYRFIEVSLAGLVSPANLTWRQVQVPPLNLRRFSSALGELGQSCINGLIEVSQRLVDLPGGREVCGPMISGWAESVIC